MEFYLTFLKLRDDEQLRQGALHWVGSRLLDIAIFTAAPVTEKADRQNYARQAEDSLRQVLTPARTKKSASAKAADSKETIQAQAAYLELLGNEGRAYKSLDDVLSAVRGLQAALNETKVNNDANA